MIRYVIDKDVCKSCGICKKVCPANCISGDKSTPYIIDQNQCLKCDACMEKCPFKAIFKNA